MSDDKSDKSGNSFLTQNWKVITAILSIFTAGGLGFGVSIEANFAGELSTSENVIEVDKNCLNLYVFSICVGDVNKNNIDPLLEYDGANKDGFVKGEPLI